MHNPDAAGGWYNGDTWEDFTGEVKAWIEISCPKPPNICGLCGEEIGKQPPLNI